MSFSDQILNGMQRLRQQSDLADGVLVSTDCLYPSNSVVQVSVRVAGDSYLVSDEGCALREVSVAGADSGRSSAHFAHIVTKQGLELDHGVIRSPFISLEQVPLAIVLVANASKELADHIFDTWRLPRSRNFKKILREMLSIEFANVGQVREQVLLGSSNKPHTFDNVVLLSDGRTLVVDPVLRDSNSINSRVVANLDVHSANHPGYVQRLVYDDEDQWGVADLSLLQVSRVPVVPYSKSSQALRTLSRAA